MSKIKSTPVGTLHFIPTFVNKEVVRLRYRVTLVSGGGMFTPSTERVVYLSYAGGPIQGTGGTVVSHLAIPLEVFVRDAEPETKADKFWE